LTAGRSCALKRGSCHLVALVLACLLVVSSILPVLESSKISTFKYEYIKSTSVPVLAVTENGEGVVGRLTIRIAYPGRGEVFFSSDPLTLLDSQASARIAVLVATQLAGVEVEDYDYFFSFVSPSITVGGPSAGAMMTAGLLSLLLDVPVKDGVVMSGMINPDGTIGPVGGVPAKVRAAAQAGFKTVLIPMGQSLVYEEVVEERRAGATTSVVVRKQPVNVTELGRSLGVYVVEVSDVVEAARIVLGVDVPIVTSSVNATYPEDLEGMLLSWTRGLLERAMSRLNETKATIETSVYIERAKELMSRSRELLEGGKLYSAASYAFQSLVEAEKAWIASNINEPEQLDSYIMEINETIESVGRRLESLAPNSISSLEAIIVSTQRLEEAKALLKNALNSILSRIDPITGRATIIVGDLDSLALSRCRALTASMWLEYAARPSPPVTMEGLEKASRTMLSYAKTVASYYRSLIGAGEGGLASDPVREFEIGFSYFEMGAYAKSIAYFIDSISDSIVAMHLAFDVSPDKIAELLMEKALQSILMLDYASGVSLGYLELGRELLLEYETGREPQELYSALRLFVKSSIHSSFLKTLVPPTSAEHAKRVIKASTDVGTLVEDNATKSNGPSRSAIKPEWPALAEILLVVALVVSTVSLVLRIAKEPRA